MTENFHFNTEVAIEPQRKLFWMCWVENATILASMPSEMALNGSKESGLIDTKDSDMNLEAWRKEEGI